jgi:hypothetical protein
LVVLLGVSLSAACSTSKGAAGPSSSILATERGGAPSASGGGSGARHSWKGHAHLDYTVPLQDPCTGTADFDLTVSVAPDGHISGSGTGGYSKYTCTTRLGTVSAPGASARFTITGTSNGDHLVFFIAPDPPGPGLPPAWPNATAGSFDVPISGAEASTIVISHQSLGVQPGRLKLTVSLTCSDCG